MALLTFKNENNQVVMLHESGTYASPSGAGIWLGKLIDHSPADSVGAFEDRYVGTDSRGFDDYTLGATTHAGTLTIEPQDFRMLKWALGFVTDTGSPGPSQHDIKEDSTGSLAPETGEFFPSFTLEDFHGYGVAGSNFVRTYKGCMVNTFSLSASEGEKAIMEIGYMAQSLVLSSGAKTAVTASTVRVKRFSDFSWFLPSGAAGKFQTPMEWSVSVDNGLFAGDYSDGSQDKGTPIPEERNYEISITAKAERSFQNNLYRKNFLGGSAFNMQLRMVAITGSDELWWTFSGCRLTDMAVPTLSEGVSENTFIIHPNQSTAKVNDLILKYDAF